MNKSKPKLENLLIKEIPYETPSYALGKILSILKISVLGVPGKSFDLFVETKNKVRILGDKEELSPNTTSIHYQEFIDTFYIDTKKFILQYHQ